MEVDVEVLVEDGLEAVGVGGLPPVWMTSAAVVIGFSARTRATARNRNSGGYGRGMDRSLSTRLDLHTEMGKKPWGRPAVINTYRQSLA